MIGLGMDDDFSFAWPWFICVETKPLFPAINTTCFFLGRQPRSHE